MSTDIIVSYDGTPNDDDALALGKMLAKTGASLSLAYVRHSREFDPSREAIAQHDAEHRLEQGAEWLGAPETQRHVVLSASTGEGLAQLAQREQASVIVFGSDYRTAPGHVEPGTSAQYLLEGGPVAIAIAPAGLRTDQGAAITAITVSAPDGDTAAAQTAQALAEKIGAKVISRADGAPDLTVVGSRPSGAAGAIALSGLTRGDLNTAVCAVLVVPQGKPVLLPG